MAGYDLKEGSFKEENMFEDELWSAFTALFSSQATMISSYKYGSLKSIITNTTFKERYESCARNKRKMLLGKLTELWG